jgi:hypothetical protein
MWRGPSAGLTLNEEGDASRAQTGGKSPLIEPFSHLIFCSKEFHE